MKIEYKKFKRVNEPYERLTKFLFFRNLVMI